MRKQIVHLLLFISCSVTSQQLMAQTYNNEWIDYSKTYYKFKIGVTGLYRISQASLTTINLQNTPAEQFQLWRNGKQVPLYITNSTGALTTNDYIEFWGEQNDGKADKYLYRDTSFQLSDKLSLQSDTAAFFLTVNTTTTANLRFNDVANSIPTNPGSPEPYFKYQLRTNFKDIINRGFAANAGEYVYSSSYDKGEFWSSSEINNSATYSSKIDSLYAVNNGSTATLKAGFAANSDQNRSLQLSFNNDNTNTVTGTLNGLDAAVFTNTTIPLSTLTANPISFNISINTQNAYDRIVCSYIQLDYPRKFNFGGNSTFTFSLPATVKGYYLQIANFKWGSVAPVLYDFTNKVRYTANTSLKGYLQFQLPASFTQTDFLLVNEDFNVGGINTINNFQQRNFINYGLAANQGDYLIISNKLLGLTAGGAVENYRAYRSNKYNAKTYDIEDLVDQFAFGIKKHPLSIKNFVNYANANFAKKPNYVFLIGKGVTYDEYRGNQSSPYADLLNLVPTWGWPASDVLLVSNSMNPEPTVGIGRLSAVSQDEVTIYLNKIKEFEAQLTTPQTIANKAWMKQVVHVAGADDPSLGPQLDNYLLSYENIIKTHPFGGIVSTFNKTTTGPVTAIYNAQLNSLFNTGIALVTYFGHGSSSVLDYANLNDPSAFNNTGKYPMFLVNGCSVGNFFDYDVTRIGTVTSIAEKYILIPSKGAIGFVGNSHFGLTNYLDTYTTGFYNSLDNAGYGSPISTNTNAAIAALKANDGGTFADFYTRTHAEETILAGDPVLSIYSSTKPDYVVEEPNVVISPSVISVADSSFLVKAYLYNIGKATSDSFVNVLIQRKYPDGSLVTLFNKNINNIIYQDSVILNVPILATRDKGTNEIIVSINSDRKIDELDFTNNSVTKSFAILDNGIVPVYPAKFAIVNKSSLQLIASTANPISAVNTYTMDIDTTELFNSPFKVTKTLTSTGGAIAFDPGILFTDSTVYYWRVAEVPTSGGYAYNTSSFVYLKNSSTGFNQSHLYQHLKSTGQRIYIDSFTRQWTYLPDSNNIVIRQAIYPAYNEDASFATLINGIIGPRSACVGHSLIFNVYDPVTLRPLYNQDVPSINQNGTTGSFMNSAAYCNAPGREFNFEYPMIDTSGRRAASNFLDWIPSGYIVTARLNYDDPIPLVDVWKADASYFGSNSLYNKLKQIGFTDLDSFNHPRTFVLIYKKNVSSFQPQWRFSKGITDAIQLSLNVASSDTLGYITSPAFGPVAAWKQLKWRGFSSENKPGDAVKVDVFGVNASGVQTDLMTLDVTNQDVDISSIDANKYPFIKLAMRNADSVYLTPYQLRYWRLLADFIPEGAIATNIKYSFNDTVDTKYTSMDTFQQGQYIKAAFAFKNISDITFRDSILIKMQIIDNNNNTTVIAFPRLKKLAPGDTAVVYTTINASKYVGNNTFSLEVNPNSSQPEMYHFNNYVYKNFYVINDNKKPVLDVTFDGVHILNNDIVSSKPAIRIKMKDDAKYLLLNDTALLTVQLVYPDGTTTQIKYDNDTLRFTPASANTTENAALIDYLPYLPQDGTYQLLVTGKDRSGNPAGYQQYKVSFQVVNKPAISNMFNYPNPFTTSTAFVFTLTGSEVPQNIKIQILTITGKVVREITKEELGNIHIGNNITSFKWDGTDMYGGKLGNGVYLYRVVTKLNGNEIDKLTFDKNNNTTNTDQFFKGGYGKMYLMR